ncbi:MAG TPA: serine hydrolase [Mucilaginibacter sp.]|nr:serine hydrolase [Mucilaginibacter sp.]
MKPFAISLAVAFVLLSASYTSAQTVDNAATDSAEKIQQVEKNLVPLKRSDSMETWTLQQRMSYYRVKGVSIAVIQNYKLAWAKGYGMADDELKIPVTDQTVFQAASISKSLNAVGVLKLVQEKKLSINADINTYLHDAGNGSFGLNQSNWKFPYDSLSGNKKITIANLLSHTAGLSVHGFAGYEKGSDIPNIVQVLDGVPPANSKPVRSMYPPGQKFEYSGGGIAITQLIVTNVTHEPYEKFMHDNVLAPMDMTSSSYSQFPPRDKRKLYATGYTTDGKAIEGRYHIYPAMAAAGLWTNPTDLAKYIIETQLAYEGKSVKVLNQQMTQVRLTPYIDDKAALGVFIEGDGGTKYFSHGGANEGFRSQYYGSLDGGNGVVVMVNSDNGNIIPEIINSVARVYGFKWLFHSQVTKPVEVAVADNVLKSYTGKYEIDPGNVLTITLDGTHKQLYGEVPGWSRFGLFPESDSKFVAKEFDIEFEFVKDGHGKVVKAVIYQDGAHDARKLN